MLLYVKYFYFSGASNSFNFVFRLAGCVCVTACDGWCVAGCGWMGAGARETYPDDGHRFGSKRANTQLIYLCRLNDQEIIDLFDWPDELNPVISLYIDS